MNTLLDGSYFEEITKLNTLSNVRTLDLYGCDNITTESGLSALRHSRVHTLDLSCCRNIRNTSCLKGVKNLIT